MIAKVRKKAEPVLDLKSTAQLFNKDIDYAKSMLKMMVDSFPNELKALEKYYRNEDWKNIQIIAHKIRGGATYCGTPRLKKICSDLESYLKSEEALLRHKLYKQLLKEIEKVKKAYSKL